MTEKSRYYPDEFDLWELPEGCGKCRQPLHMASNQNIAFCPNCAIDRRNAQLGREKLEAMKARLAVIKEREKNLKGLRGEDAGDSSWPEGLPL